MFFSVWSVRFRMRRGAIPFSAHLCDALSVDDAYPSSLDDECFRGKRACELGATATALHNNSEPASDYWRVLETKTRSGGGIVHVIIMHRRRYSDHVPTERTQPSFSHNRKKKHRRHAAAAAVRRSAVRDAPFLDSKRSGARELHDVFVLLLRGRRFCFFSAIDFSAVEKGCKTFFRGPSANTDLPRARCSPVSGFWNVRPRPVGPEPNGSEPRCFWWKLSLFGRCTIRTVRHGTCYVVKV